jgi:hypothetical protein
MSDYRRGFGLVTRFIDHLQMVTRSNYGAIANLHTLQITRAHAKPSQSAFIRRSLVTDLNSGDSSTSVLTPLPAANTPQLKTLESEPELLYDYRFTTNQLVLAPSPLRLTTSISFQLNPCGHSPYVTSSLMRGRVCRLQLLLVLASVLIPGSDSRGTHDHTLLYQIKLTTCSSCPAYSISERTV